MGVPDQVRHLAWCRHPERGAEASNSGLQSIDLSAFNAPN